MRVFPLSDHALVVEVGEDISRATHQRVQRAWRVLEAARLPGAREFVPAYTTVTMFYDVIEVARAGADPDRLCAFLEERVREVLGVEDSTDEAPASRTVQVPVCYEPAFALDLDDVARHTQLSTAEVVRLHCSAEYCVHLLGFAPGFPYLGGLPSELRVPRRAAPRTRVPAGAVAIAGEQAGIYPLPTPGGWNVIGQTPLRLFRPDATPPTLLAPGDRVRFVPISAAAFACAAADAP